MTVKSKRIRTKFLGGAVEGEMLDTFLPGVLVQWIVQHNITVIGCELIAEIDMTDSLSNADYESQLIIELTRAGTIEQDSCISSLQLEICFNGVVSIGGDLRKTLVMMFPEGYGVDVDEGEILNLVAYFSFVSAGAPHSYGSCIVYYVENG